MISLAPRMVQNIRDRLGREAITVLHPASTTSGTIEYKWNHPFQIRQSAATLVRSVQELFILYKPREPSRRGH